MTRFRTLLTVTAFGTIALQATGAFAGGHSNHSGNLTPRYSISAAGRQAPPKYLPVRHPIDFPTGKPKIRPVMIAGPVQPKGTTGARPTIGGATVTNPKPTTSADIVSTLITVVQTLVDVTGGPAFENWQAMAQQMLHKPG
jgi:hypothetical protein